MRWPARSRPCAASRYRRRPPIPRRAPAPIPSGAANAGGVAAVRASPGPAPEAPGPRTRRPPSVRVHFDAQQAPADEHVVAVAQRLLGLDSHVGAVPRVVVGQHELAVLLLDPAVLPGEVNVARKVQVTGFTPDGEAGSARAARHPQHVALEQLIHTESARVLG